MSKVFLIYRLSYLFNHELVVLLWANLIFILPDIWQWSELTSFGDLPSPRDFAAASAIGNRKIVMWVLIIASNDPSADLSFFFS